MFCSLFQLPVIVAYFCSLILDSGMFHFILVNSLLVLCRHVHSLHFVAVNKFHLDASFTMCDVSCSNYRQLIMPGSLLLLLFIFISSSLHFTSLGILYLCVLCFCVCVCVCNTIPLVKWHKYLFDLIFNHISFMPTKNNIHSPFPFAQIQNGILQLNLFI